MRIKLIDDEPETPAIQFDRRTLLDKLRDELRDKEELAAFLKELEEKKKKEKDKPKKIAAGLSVSEIVALMWAFALPITAVTMIIMNYSMTIIRANLHEMIK